MDKRYINSGQTAKCYEINGRAYKEYKSQLIADEIENNIIKLSKYKSNSFIFPEELVYERDKFIGYYMKYIDGVKIFHLGSNIELDSYINAIIEVEDDVCNITNQNILISGPELTNTMYSRDNKLYFIDTDYYTVGKTNKDLLCKNLYKVSYALLYPFFDIFETEFILSNLNNYLNLIRQGKMLPSVFLSNLIIILEQEKYERLKTIKDVNNSLDLILKK